MIGIGTYRMSIKNNSHYESIVYSIQNGCRLIDTASNYKRGESELLVGKVINETRFAKLGIKVITKAGYVDTSEEDQFKACSFLIDEKFYYCIDPRFLEYKLKLSLNRLKVKKVHAFLIHNPEYLLNSLSGDIFYSSLKESLEYLEKLVDNGVIECYGISSNTIADIEHPNHIDLEKIIGIVRNINSNHHFKYIQTPFNLFEKQPLLKCFSNNSLNFFEFAKENNIKTIINRPFLASANRKTFRLVTYSRDNFNSEKHSDAFTNYKKSILGLIGKSEENKSIFNRDEFLFLEKNWKNFNSEKILQNFVEKHIHPLLIEYKINLQDPEFQKIEKSFMGVCKMYIRKSITERNNILKTKILEENPEFNNNESFASILCRFYLKKGADIILTGMRKKEYVDDIINLL